MQAFRKTIQSTAHKYDLWHKEDRILLGISGGADSTALFHFFLSLKEKYRFTLFVAHVNYHLRGRESDLDEYFVKKLCKENKIPCLVLASHPKQYDENTLRTIRFSFFEKLQKKYTCNSIALAHHQDDQAETLLMRLFRGSGLYGMRGMQPKNPPFIRPFLFISRDDILTYLKQNNFSFREDASNKDIRFTRNYLRHTIIPLIQKDIQPNLTTLLSQTALQFAEDDSSLQAMLKEKFSCKQISQGVSFSLKNWHSLSLSLKRRALIHSIEIVCKGRHKSIISFGLIEEIRNALSQNKSKKQKVSFSHLILERSGDTVTLFYRKK